MMAMMLVASATAFAGDSDALKAILKAKDYSEAESLLKSSLSQLANDAEKAKAYNKLVDLAYAIYEEQDKIRTTNMVMKKDDPVDMDAMIQGGKNALQAAMECDKYDQMPNEKGKVAPKFHDKNQARTLSLRLALLQATEKLVNDKKSKEAFEIFDTYLTSAKSPFFKGVKEVENDPNQGYAAYYGGLSALQIENYVKAKEFFKLGVRDTNKAISEYSLGNLLQSMKDGVKSAADSANYINELIELNKDFSDKEKVYAFLSEAYMNNGETSKVLSLADDRLAKFPESSLPRVYKGIIYQNEHKFDEAIAEYNKVKEDDDIIYKQCVLNRAICKWNQARDLNELKADPRTGKVKDEDAAKIKEILNSSQLDFEKVKELDPENTLRWAYLLHNVYTQTGQKEKADELGKAFNIE